MNSRYEILDILAQDASGVVFQAQDKDSGQEVALRRFFPFGVEGGGLEGEEKTAYEIAVRRLRAVTHPALRSVVDGGTDPVDGMPFLVTEWLEGEPLSERLRIRPLSPPSAKALADLALDCSLALSETFQEEAVWVETQAESIVLGSEDESRKVTFWISPVRWLGDAGARSGLQPIVDMIEDVTGWMGDPVADHMGDGLGWWLNELRRNPMKWNLQQARTALHEGPQTATATPTMQAHAPAPAGPQTIPGHYEPATSGDKSQLRLWIIAGLLTGGALGFIGWQATRKAKTPPPVAVQQEEARTENSGIEVDISPSMTPAEIASLKAEAYAKAGAENSSGMVVVGQSFALKILVTEVRESKSGKTVYLEFDPNELPPLPCARYLTKKNSISLKELKRLKGKQIDICGIVVNDPSNRTAIDLVELDQLEILEP